MINGRDALGRSHRYQPVRRLSAAECDLIEYAGPLVLAEQEIKFLFGPWRGMRHYVITHHSRGLVWEGTVDELEARGLSLEETPT